MTDGRELCRQLCAEDQIRPACARLLVRSTHVPKCPSDGKCPERSPTSSDAGLNRKRNLTAFRRLKFADIVRAVPRAHPADLAVSAGVIAIVLAARAASAKIPGLLIAVIAAIIVSREADLARHGVAVLGPIPRGLPHLGLPALGWHDAAALAGTAVSLFVVILAQSAATSRAYAGKYEEAFSQDTDLVGLGAANVAAALSGTFVVNGSPTQTQVADSAGARSQLAQLTTSAVVLIVLLLLTGPLASLPISALAAIVFLIAIGLIDIAGMRRILACRRDEFTIALLTTAAVVIFGVEVGLALAVAASIIDHLRHTYRPLSSLLVKSPAGHWQLAPVRPGARSEEGLAVYRFGTSLYYANAAHLIDDVTALAAQGSPLRWLVLDAAAIGDIDYTAAGVLTRTIGHLRKRHIRFAFSSVLRPVRQQLDRYGISAALDRPPTTTPPARPLRPSTPRKGPSPSKPAHARQHSRQEHTLAAITIRVPSTGVPGHASGIRRAGTAG